MTEIFQGNILKVEKLKFPVFVASKDFFNRTGQAVVCPAPEKASDDPLHISVQTEGFTGVVLCEQMKLLDLSVRGYKKIAELRTTDIMNIADAIQGIFDYYPFGR